MAFAIRNNFLGVSRSNSLAASSYQNNEGDQHYISNNLNYYSDLEKTNNQNETEAVTNWSEDARKSVNKIQFSGYSRDRRFSDDDAEIRFENDVKSGIFFSFF